MRHSYVERFGFEDDADEDLWAMRDYFLALKMGLVESHSPEMWSSFRAGYAYKAHDSQRDYRPPTYPARRAA
jgi:hypothetical protein